ncbi:hypothetical protein KPH14_000982 [Odynerus spinipes]|uniref:Uncharacterized protein n=1 Tax=Odynerus spinipes TaxID=1348599 RepID=A0AAD9VLP1_9HYME|nr:hypothetical protein KPH14_000982 [Odynerus spinipes]
MIVLVLLLLLLTGLAGIPIDRSILQETVNIADELDQSATWVSLCDEYSLPVDFVNKKRPASAAAATSSVQWTLPSPTVENAEVEIVEQYSDPRDSKSKAYIEPGAQASLPTIYSKVNRNYCRPYTVS